jgi:hypothetical protein
MPATEAPWYASGLRFACTQCGDCCTGAPGYVWVTTEEIEALRSFLGLSLEAFGRRYLRWVEGRLSLIEKANGDCVFFERGCQVYPARPGQCRTFPFWPENLARSDDWQAIGAECPGVGFGRLYPPEEIEVLSRGQGSTS